MSKLKPKSDTLAQVKGEVKQLSDAVMKERLRPLVPRAIERIQEMIESRNEAVAMGAAKLVISRFVPEVRAIELQGNEKKPILITLDINEVHRPSKVSTEAEASV